METKNMKPEQIVDKMMDKDAFSRWLGIHVDHVAEGECELKMTVRADMLNGFGIAHGGITYSLADSALAFASNSSGIQSLSIETSVSHVKKVREGDIIVAVARKDSESGKFAYFTVNVHLNNNKGTTVALFKGIVYKTSQLWD